MTGAVPWWRSIRLPIALAAALVTLAVLLGAGIVVDRESAIDGRERLRGQALDRLEAAAVVYSVNEHFTNGVTIDSTLPPPVLREQVQKEGATATYLDDDYMWASTRLGPEVLLTLRMDTGELDAQRSQLRRSMVTAGAIGLALSALFGWLAASGVSRRLRRGARAASLVGDSVGPDGPGVRASVGGHDEVTALTSAVDRMAADLADRVRREQRFGADVAHELRTPLTALVSSAELLPDDDVGRLVRGQVDRLRRLVEDLLELFRAESAQAVPQLEVADLGSAVDRALAGLAAAPTVVVLDSADVLLDPARLERVLTNLVTNARLHGGGDVEVEVDGTSVTVRDHGPGFPDQVIRDGPGRFQRWSGQAGSGLGLAIAQVQSQVMGAELELSNHADGGAVARVVWEPAPQVRGGAAAG